jgi:hypothetical protein
VDLKNGQLVTADGKPAIDMGNWQADAKEQELPFGG